MSSPSSSSPSNKNGLPPVKEDFGTYETQLRDEANEDSRRETAYKQFLKQELPLPYTETRDSTSYTFYGMETPETIEPCILTFSVASTNRLHKTRNFRAGSDVCYRIVHWTATRRNFWPKFPIVDETNGPLVRREVTPLAPMVEGAGPTKIYVIKGRDIYVRDYPKNSNDTITSGALPVFQNNQHIHEITSDYQESLA